MRGIKGLQLSCVVLAGMLVAGSLVGCGGGGTGVVAGAVTGTVVDVQQQRGVAGATVTVDGTTYTTNSSGSFSVPELSAGTHTITVSAPGYSTVGPITVTVAAGTSTLDPIFITPTTDAPPEPPTL